MAGVKATLKVLKTYFKIKIRCFTAVGCLGINSVAQQLSLRSQARSACEAVLSTAFCFAEKSVKLFYAFVTKVIESLVKFFVMCVSKLRFDACGVRDVSCGAAYSVWQFRILKLALSSS